MTLTMIRRHIVRARACVCVLSSDLNLADKNFLQWRVYTRIRDAAIFVEVR